MSEENKQFGEVELDTVMSFAQGLYGFLDSGIWSPALMNQALIGLNNSPSKANYEKVTKALENALQNADELQGYSQYMYVFDTIYSKTIKHYEQILAFDLSMVCTNVKDVSEYNSKEYKEDLKRIYKFLDKWDYKRDFNKSIKDILKTGVYYGWLRDSYGTFDDNAIDVDESYSVKRQQKFALQTMPQKYCKITGYWENGLLYDFNMSYFMQAGTDINLFDPSFRKKFKDLYVEEKYNPSAQLRERNGAYSKWIQTSPIDGAICLKFDDSNFNVIPPFGNLMKATFDNTEIQQLQKNKNLASAYNLLYGSMKTMNGQKGAEKVNNFAIDPKTMGKFLQLVAQGFKGTAKVAGLPLEDVHYGQYTEQNPNMVKTAIKNSADQGAFSGDVVYSENKNIFNSTQAIIEDYNIMRQLYPQFARVLEYYANRKTKKYKFHFTFDGSNYPFEREYRTKRINELFTVGLIPNESYIASTYGIEPQDFSRMLEESHNGDLTSKLTMLLNKNTMSQSENKGGGQIKDDSELSDGGDVSRNYE